LRTAFVEDFESYAVGPPYEQDGSPWVQAEAGRNALGGRVLQSSWAHDGTRSFIVHSYLNETEIAYVPLALDGPPRQVVIELWYAPNRYFVYKDFAEFGLGVAHSRFDLDPTVALEVNDHVLEFRADPEKPVASSNGAGGFPAAEKPPFQPLFNEVVYAPCSSSSEPPTCPAVYNYFRIELDFCADTVRAFVGSDSDAPLGGSGTFDGRKPVNAFYLAGGLNATYIDDIRVSVDDG